MHAKTRGHQARWFFTSLHDTRPTSGHVMVDSVPLSELILAHSPTIIKLDVEGSEFAVLASILEEGVRPSVVMFELKIVIDQHGGMLAVRLLNLLGLHSYVAFGLGAGPHARVTQDFMAVDAAMPPRRILVITWRAESLPFSSVDKESTRCTSFLWGSQGIRAAYIICPGGVRVL